MAADPLHRLRKLYRDAHQADAPSDQHAIEWARDPMPWATDQIRFRGWSYLAAEATVRECRRLYARLQRHDMQQQQEPQS